MRLQKASELDPVVWYEPEFKNRIVPSKDTWQGPRCEPAGQIEDVSYSEFWRQFVTLGKRHGNRMISLVSVQEVVHSKKTREEETMPLFVGRVLREAVDTLCARAVVTRVSKRTPPRSKSIAQLPLGY